MTFSITRRVLNRARMLDFLPRLAEAPVTGVRTLYLPAGTTREKCQSLLKETPVPVETVSDIVSFSVTSQMGSVGFISSDKVYLLAPPFPVKDLSVSDGFDIAPLVTAIRHNHRIALVLVRLGAYAIGVCEGEKLVTSKIGTGLVHGRHRQGGSSAHRFERHRDKQIETFLNRVCGHVQEQLGPYLKTIDYTVYGGAWETIQLLVKYCPILKQFDDRLLPPLLEIPDPRMAVLEEAVTDIWSTKLIEWQADR
jgi:hypothetical protein